MWQISYDAKEKGWQSEPITIPLKTGVLASLGSGAKITDRHVGRWKKSDVGDRSSSIFSAFYDAVTSKADPLSGGAPQIAALFSSLGPQIIGFVKDGVHYLHGLELVPGKMLAQIEWRDELFQRIDPMTLKRKSGARRFARPAGV
jgi:hypothetical protein